MKADDAGPCLCGDPFCGRCFPQGDDDDSEFLYVSSYELTQRLKHLNAVGLTVDNAIARAAVVRALRRRRP